MSKKNTIVEEVWTRDYEELTDCEQHQNQNMIIVFYIYIFNMHRVCPHSGLYTV